METVIERQTVVVHQDLAGPLQEWTGNFNLLFHPDEIIVRNVLCIGSSVAPVNVHGIFVDFTNATNDIILTFHNAIEAPYVSNPHTHYRVKDTSDILNGSVTFRVRSLNGNIGASVCTDTISFTLEFVKYEKRRDPSKELEKISKQLGGFYELFSTANVHATTVEPVDTFTGVPQTLSISQPEAKQVLTEAQKAALKKVGISVEEQKQEPKEPKLKP